MTDDRLPIKIDSTSNGEYRPLPVPKLLRKAHDLANRRLTENARRTGISRRAFVNGLCGAATTLAAFNTVFAARGNLGGRFALPAEAALDMAAAEDSLAGDEFIFDVQTHLIEPKGGWRQSNPGFERILRWWPQGDCGESDPVDCYSAAHYLKEVFHDSDTTMAVLSFIPAPADRNPLSMAEA
ncbi:MAG: amidohydrolase, partial [Rhodospirillaceae bacterium]|nr:amidohydrolase [Rhodospirillaceae bacterium]